MAISYAELSQIISEGTQDSFSDRYRPSVRVGAANWTIRRAANALGYAMANRKGAEEWLRELTMLRVFQTNSQGGVNLADPSLGASIWNVLGVYARPLTVEAQTILPIPPDQSQYRPDLSFSGTGSPVERVTLEEVPMIRTNMFRNGNEVLADNPKRVSFSYYIIGDASSTNYASPQGSELRVLPQSQTGQQLVAISYIKQPTYFTGPSGSVEYPQSALQTLGEWCLEYISWPQGDPASLQTLASKDAQTLFGTIA